MGTVCIQRDSWVDDLKMSVIFPNMDTARILENWRN